MVIENSCHEISIAAGAACVGLRRKRRRMLRGLLFRRAPLGLGCGEEISGVGWRLLRHPLELRPACNSHARLMNLLPLTALANFVPRDFVLLVSSTC